MSIFKAYDIRGVYPSEINEEIIYKIARSCSIFFQGEKVLIGGDGRISTPSLKKAAIKGLLHEGLKVYDVGMISTSSFNFLISQKEFDFGLQITASHNPKEFNGVKIYDKEGNSIGLGFGLEKIEEIFKNLPETSKKKGIYKKDEGLKELHKNFLEKNAESFDGKICIDFSNGCGSIIFSEVINGKIDAIKINEKVDGNFPAHPPEPNEENLKELQKIIKEKKCSFGIAFDGDADRIVFLDENGKIFRGDVILFLYSKYLKPKKVVYEVSFPPLFSQFLQKMKIEGIESKVGRSFIINEMKKNSAEIGGEISSHFYFQKTNYMEDAFYAFFEFLKIVKREKEKVSELAKEYPILPSQTLKLKVKEEEKYKIVENLKEEISKHYKTLTIDGVKVVLDEKNWFLIRASNTEPIIRVYIEGENQKKLEENKKIVEDYLTKFI